MPALVQISINSSALYPLHKYRGTNTKHLIYKLNLSQPINYYSRLRTKIECIHRDGFKAEALREKLPFLGVGKREDGILVSKGRRVVAMRFNNGFNGLGGGGGGDGGGRINSETARVLGNLALAILLTYLSMTGQLGWLLDAIVSLWVVLSLFFCAFVLSFEDRKMEFCLFDHLHVCSDVNIEILRDICSSMNCHRWPLFRNVGVEAVFEFRV